MNSKQIIKVLEEQVVTLKGHNMQLLERIDQLLAQIGQLYQTINSLEEALGKALNSKRALAKIAFPSSEAVREKKQSMANDAASAEETVQEEPKKTAKSPKERGNNNARRKKHEYMETQEHDIYPFDGFVPGGYAFIKTVDKILYEYIPPRFIKHVYRLHYYSKDGKIYYGKVPFTPLLNSNFDASLIAGIIQLRYIYSMPLERIGKFFKESGFDIPKSTIHGLIRKASGMLACIGAVLRDAVLEDSYLHFDESYQTVLERNSKSPDGKKSCKGYFWAAMSHHSRLVHFFYEKGSRKKSVFTDYLPSDYGGTIQTDGYEPYKSLETTEYPNAIRIACAQHIKRKFLDIKNKTANKMVNMYNELYHLEHKIPAGYTPEEVMRYKQEVMCPVFDKIKNELLIIQADKKTLPKSNLGKAVNYALKEHESLCNYLKSADYRLDNNDMERINRYISLGRKNSLFSGSHEGAERTALIYSLACSCRLHGINSFEYFVSLINKMAVLPPKPSKEIIRELLPDRWHK
jgi:uncharacterized protein YoxC